MSNRNKSNKWNEVRGKRKLNKQKKLRGKVLYIMLQIREDIAL